MGDIFDLSGYRFEIVDMDGQRVDKVLVSRSVNDPLVLLELLQKSNSAVMQISLKSHCIGAVLSSFKNLPDIAGLFVFTELQEVR